MICKGNTHQNGTKLAGYLTTPKEGEHVVRGEMRGYATNDLTKAFRSVHVMADGTRCEQPFFHVQVRNPEGEELSRAQWKVVAARIESKLGLTDQPRAIVFHVNKETGHEHMHVAWSRIDEETMKAVSLPFFKTRLKEVARDLENEFGITRVKNKRDGSVQAPNRDEFEQARRLGVDIKQVRQTIRNCWEHSDNGASFRSALADQNLMLAQGDRRDFLVLDHEGGLHALGKKVLGVTAAQIRSRVRDINGAELPTVAQARGLISERHRDPKGQSMPDPNHTEMAWEDALAKAAIEKEKIERRFAEPTQGKGMPGRREKEPRIWEETTDRVAYKFKDAALETGGSTRLPKPLYGIEKQIWSSYRSASNPKKFADALDRRGLAFACVTRDEADQSYRDTQFAKAVGRVAPVYQENEIVVVRSPGLEFLRQSEWTTPSPVQKLDQGNAQKYLEALGLDKSKVKGIGPTKEDLNTRAAQRGAEWERIRLENSQQINRFAPKKEMGVKEPVALGKQAGRTLGKAPDAVGNAIESLIAPISTPEQKFEGERETRKRQVDAAERIDLASTLAHLAEERQRRKQEGQETRQSRNEERDRR